MGAVRLRAWWVVAVAGLAAGAAFVTTGSADVRVACLGATAVLTVAATLTGPWLHRPRRRSPWWFMAASEALMLAGATLRPWSVAQQGPAAAVGDLFSLAGYAACIAALLLILRSRGGVEPFALLDGAVAALGALAVAVVLFALPAAAVSDRPTWISVLAAVYPVLDVVVLLVLLNLGFTTAGGLPAYRTLTASMLALVVGDTGYAVIGAQGRLVGSPLQDLPYLAAYTLFGVTALLPSMTRLSSPAALPPQAWSRRRLAVLLPALAVPAVLLLVLPDASRVDRSVLAATTLGALALLVGRALAAVHDHADAQRVLRRQASTDGLTGLLNRSSLGEAVEDRLATGDGSQDLWAVSVDLDNFRFVNDTWGHGTGDQLLVRVAGRLRDAAPPGSLLARMGGDEFVVVAVGDRDVASGLAEELRQLLRAPVEVDGMDFVVTASVGLASARHRGLAIDLFRDADTALSHAKTEGRDRCVVFDERMRDVVRDRLEIETALRSAVQRGQVRVAYQPLVDISSQDVVGCEALVRWDHPTRGPVSPVDFIPVAEETGIILELGAWVLGQAARQAAQWHRDGTVGPDFFVSVNVSPRQLAEDAFLGTVAATLQHSGLAPDRLVLEITESAMLADPERTVGVLHRLRDLGVGLSLDDFGTGYSSLSHLSRLPVTTVKLDRSFVDRLDDEDAEVTIVHAVEAMSRAMDLKMVAEGVETQEQLRALRGLGVPVGQGWLWGAAVDPEAFRGRWGRTPEPGATRAASGQAAVSGQAAASVGNS